MAEQQGIGSSISDPASALVSVIIPAYNAREFVMDAIASVKAQQHPALEILLIDDGSTDGTAELVAGMAPEVRIIRQENSGVAAARNTGLRCVRGEFITFVDADDGWFPGKLKAQLDYLAAHPEVGLVFHRWLVWKSDESGVFHWPSPPEELPSEPELSGWLYLPLLLDCVIHTSTVMVRRSIIEQVGFFDTSLEIGEDYEYWLRISRQCQMHKLAPVYSFYRAVTGSLTTSKPRKQNFEYLVVRRALERWGRTAPDGSSLPTEAIEHRLGKLAFDFAYAHLCNGSPKLAREASIQAFRHGPRRLKPALFYFASLFRTDKT